MVAGELPDFCVAAGAPATVIRRYVDGEGWVPALTDVTVTQASPPSSPGGMQCGMALPVVKSMTVLVTGLPLTNVSR